MDRDSFSVTFGKRMDEGLRKQSSETIVQKGKN